MLIAITGKAGAGKDTAADALTIHAWFTRLAFADPLKNSCVHKFNLSVDDVYTREGKKRYIPEWGMTVGEILQIEGTEATKATWGQDFWVKRWLMDYEAMQDTGHDNIVVTDCRFDAEAKAIKELGGTIVEIQRPGHQEEGRDPNHASEAGISRDLIDVTYVNNRSVADLEKFIRNLAGGFAK